MAFRLSIDLLNVPTLGRFWVIHTAVVLLVCCLGCGKKTRAVVFPVSGKLMAGEKPADNASIAFHPVNKPSSDLLVYPVGVTSSEGAYQLTSYDSGDGAPAGEYAVTVIWHDDFAMVNSCECPDPLDHDRLCAEYADPTTTPLRATVKAGQTNEITLRTLDLSARYEVLKATRAANNPVFVIPDAVQPTPESVESLQLPGQSPPAD